MTISFAGSTTTVTDEKSGGTATAGGNATLTDSSKSWTTNTHANRIVWLSGGTGVGQSRMIVSNTGTVLTVDVDWDTNPSTDTTYSICYNNVDLTTDSSAFSYNGTATYKTIESTGHLTLSTDAAVADIETDTLYTLDEGEINSIADTFLQFGRITESGRGVGGGTVQLRKNTTGAYGHITFAGVVKFYNCRFMVKKTFADTTNSQLVINQYETDPDGIAFLDSSSWRISYYTYANDSFKYTKLYKSNLSLREAPAAFIGNTSYESSLNPRATASQKSGGLDIFDHVFIGVVSAGAVDKPIFMYNDGQGANTQNIYFWNVLHHEYDELADAIQYYQYSTFTAPCPSKVYGGYTVSFLVQDDALYPIEDARLCVLDINDDAAIVTSKTSYLPDKSSSVLTDSDGIYEGPFGTDEGMFVITEMCEPDGATGNLIETASATTYNPFTLKIRKYGYEFIQQSRDWDSRTAESIVLTDNDFVAVSESTAAAYTGIAISGSGETITVSSAHSMQEIYDYSQDWACESANIIYDEPILTSDGVNFVLASGWELIFSVDPTSAIRITGDVEMTAVFDVSDFYITGTLNFTAAGTYAFTDCVVDEVTNSSGGAVTINAVTSTFTLNTGPSITINNSVNITIYVKDSTTKALISNARVFLETDESSAVEIFNEVTGGDGMVTTTYNYSSDQDVVGVVRQGSSSPYYKSSEVVGTILSSGLEITVLLISDE